MNLEECFKMLLKLALHQAKPFIIECKKYSTTLLNNSIKSKSTWCHSKKQFAMDNHKKTLEDYGAQNVSTDWNQFRPLELLIDSTSSFLLYKRTSWSHGGILKFYLKTWSLLLLKNYHPVKKVNPGWPCFWISLLSI